MSKRIVILWLSVLLALLLTFSACTPKQASAPAPSPSSAPAPAPTPSPPAPAAQPTVPPAVYTEVTGTLVGLSGSQLQIDTGTQTLTLDFVGNTQVVLANGQPGKKADLSVGMKVQVQYLSSMLVAAKITVLQSAPTPAPSPTPPTPPAPPVPPATQPTVPPAVYTEVTGTIVGLSGSQLQIDTGTQTITLDFVGGTQVVLANGQPGKKTDLTLGMKVQVQYLSSMLVAAKVTILQ